MKVRHLSGPKAGLTEHLENTVGRTLIAMGVAEAIPLPPYGSKGWLEAIKEIDAMRTAPSQYDTVPPNANGIEWTATTMASGQTRIVKKVDGTVWWYDAPPADCPPAIREQFIQLANINPGANAAALEIAQHAQCAYEAKIKHAKRF